MDTYNKKIIFLILLMLQLNGCAFLLIGAGVGVIGRVSNAKYEQIELETKEEYGHYKLEMQQKDIEPILTYKEWLKEQIKDPEKAKRWKKILDKIEKEKAKE